MSTDLQYLEEWIPERMDPGTVFVLENQTKLGNAQNPYVAVMSCPRCGTMGLITRRQLCAGEAMICGGESAPPNTSWTARILTSDDRNRTFLSDSQFVSARNLLRAHDIEFLRAHA